MSYLHLATLLFGLQPAWPRTVPDGARGAADTVDKLRRSLEAAGVDFLPAREDAGEGVRLKAPPGPRR